MKLWLRAFNRPTILFFIAGILLTQAVSGQYWNEDTSCFHCHSGQVKEFSKSIHFNQNISCRDCHGGEINISGTIISVNVMSGNFIGVPTRSNIMNMCSNCHNKVTDVYKESIHWKELEKGVEIAATCTDCHGAHDILSSRNPKSLTYPDNVSLMCSGCHENQTKMSAWYYGIKTDRFDTYKKSYHYKAYLANGKVLAACPDCHENHGTRSESDPKSTIYPANLASTCGKTDCHLGAEKAYVYGGKVHEEAGVYILSIDVKKLVTYFYIIMIIFELAFTFGLIFLGISSNFELRRRH